MASISVTVASAGGSGQITVPFSSVWCRGISLTSPDDTPMYDFLVYDGDGQLVISSSSIDVQKTKIDLEFKLDGACIFMISNAADAGVYLIKPHSK